MFALDCPTQSYDWGSTHAIPSFQRQEADGTPIAEVWVGTHPLGTARIVDGSAEPRPLTEVAGDLGFMLKVLAADRPLSIQVHPNAARAASGYAAEEAAGVPIDAPHRVFKDPHPKPEMVYALSTFDTLVGLRRTSEIMRILNAVQHPLAEALMTELVETTGFGGIVRLIERLLSTPPSPAEVTDFGTACHKALDAGRDVKRAFETAVELSETFPGDVGVLLSLFLNRLTLQAGEAAYLATGIIHAHLRGLCLEVMVSSDNVLRAGLTHKHVDPQGLVRCLEEGSARAARVEPIIFNYSTDIFSPSDEFGLSITQSSPADPAGVVLPASGQRLLVCTDGEVALVNMRDEVLRLGRGDVAYADDSDGELRVAGTGEIAQAFVPATDARGQLFDLI